MSVNNPKLISDGKNANVCDVPSKSFRTQQHSVSTALDLAPRTGQESTKSAFTTPPVQSSLTSRPLIAAPVSSTSTMSQPVIAKSSHVTAPVMPVSQLHGTTMATTTVASSFAPMASIIRGTPHMHKPATSHMPHPVVQATYSSHVPRGVGTVACITTLKSSVATPMQRPSHLIPQAAASNLSSLPLFMQMQPRPAGLALGKNPPNTPVSKPSQTAATPMEPSRFVTNVTTATSSVVIASSRMSDAVIRPTLVHATPMMPKPQPFSQHIQQLSEKGLYKSGAPPSSSPSAQPVGSVLHAITAVSQNSQPSATLHLTPAPSSGSHHGLRVAAANVQPTTGATAKNNAPTVHTVMPITQMPTQQQHALISAAVTTARAVAVSTTSTGILNTQRLVTNTQSSTQIPVAKVYPQPLPVTPRLASDNIGPAQEVAPSTTAGVFVTPPPRGQTANSNVAAAGLTSVQSLPPTVILTEARQERSSLVSSAPYTLPPVTTYYYDPFPNTLTMHQYPGNAAPHTFGVVPAAAFRTVSAHQAGNLPSGGQPGRSATIAVTTSGAMHMNSMMVTVNPARNHVGLQTTYCTAAEVNTTSSTPLMVTAVSPSHPAHNIQLSQNSPSCTSNPSVSPRPSILRKRTADTTGIRKQLLPSLSGSQPPSPHEPTSSVIATAINTLTSSQSPKPQIDATRESSTPSESNDSNSNNGAQLLVIKKEPLDPTEVIAGNSVNPMAAEASPRKKPRKQQLMGKELVETHAVDAADDFQQSIVKKEIVREDEDGVRWVSTKQRPPISLINSYRHTWKSRHNHFMRYSDIKPKEERRPTVNDFANQRGILQKANGWKVWHLCTQIDEMVELESSAHTTLSVILDGMEKKIGAKENEDKDLNRANELIRGNLQRSKIIHDQMKDARLQILKVLDHKSNIVDIVGKYVSKRSIRKKEKM